MSPGGKELEHELRDLMLLSLAGDQKAYEAFLRRVARMIRRYLGSALGGRSDGVEDLVQEVLLSIHRKRHTYRPEMALLPWVFAIARYRMIDHLRAERRRPFAHSVNLDWESLVADPDPEQPGAGADVDQLLGQLSERQQRILRLAKLEERPLAEIAQTMRMSLSAVKVTIHRALAKLKKAQEGSDGNS